MAKHNKKRDTAILFEMLVRHATASLMEDKKDVVAKTMGIIKKFFRKGSPLNEELRAFRILLNSHVKSPETAKKVLSEVCEFTKSLSSKNIDKQKSLLIKEINHNLDAKQLFSYRIPEYRTYATAQILFNDSRSKRTPLENVERIQLEEQIIERLTGGKVTESADFLKVNPKHSQMINKFVTKRFVEKYQKVLSEDQKTLLTRYAINLLSEGGDKQFNLFISEQIEKIKKSLSEIKDGELTKDSELMSKIGEAKQKLSLENFQKVDDEKVVQLLQYMALSGEIK